MRCTRRERMGCTDVRSASLVLIEMGFAQGRRPLCFFLAEGSSQHVGRGAAAARGGSGEMPTPVLCNAPRSQPWPPQASRAGTLAPPHAPPRIDAHTSCVYVSYLCVCVCQYVTQQSLVLRVRVRVRVTPAPSLHHMLHLASMRTYRVCTCPTCVCVCVQVCHSAKSCP